MLGGISTPKKGKRSVATIDTKMKVIELMILYKAATRNNIL